MKVLVTTPTGQIGRRILAELIAPEFSVRVIVRDPERLPAEIRSQVEVVRGSTDDAVALRRALEGVETMFWCVPTESPRESTIERHYEGFARAAGQAIREARTPRVVTISAAGRGLSRKTGRIFGLHAMEEILDQSATAIRHLRCGIFMENFLAQARTIREQGLFSFPISGKIPLPMTAVNDVADCALRWLARRDWGGVEGVVVYGPEKLSFNQAAVIMERVLEQRVHYRESAADDYIEGLVSSGASVDYARGQVEMLAALAKVVTCSEPAARELTTSVRLSAWTRKELLPVIKSDGLKAVKWSRREIATHAFAIARERCSGMASLHLPPTRSKC